MRQWSIRDVMSTDVITVSDDASVAEVAATLAERRISAVPIVNQFEVVVGVVSWTDLHHTINPGQRHDNARGGWLHRHRPAELRWPDQAAIEVMSAPPVTVGSDASLPAAGRLMHHHNVGRLLVTDRAGRLVGIVTRRDLLKGHARLDAVIGEEVTQRILHRTLMVQPNAVQVTVDDGVVTLTGRTSRRSTALAAVGLTEAVAGVTGVVDRLSFDTDDTVRTPTPRPPADHPMHGWWVGRQHNEHASGTAARALDANHARPVHPPQPATSETVR